MSGTTVTYECNACRNEVVFDESAPFAGCCGAPDCDRRSGKWAHVGTDCGRLLWAYGPYPTTVEKEDGS